jgi:TonB family protein
MCEKSNRRGVFVAKQGTAKFLQLATLAFMVALAVTAGAADVRAVQSRVAPTYPEIAKRLRIIGIVRLEVTVDPSGKVTDVKPVSGNRLLSPAAEEAVRHWKFVPGTGISTVPVDVNFSAGD